MIQKNAVQRFEACDDGWFDRFFRPATQDIVDKGKEKPQNIVNRAEKCYSKPKL